VSPLRQNKIVKNNLSGWDKAIEDAKKGIRRLEIAIDDCRAKKAAGEPWPGTQSSNQNSEPCHEPITGAGCRGGAEVGGEEQGVSGTKRCDRCGITSDVVIDGIKGDWTNWWTHPIRDFCPNCTAIMIAVMHVPVASWPAEFINQEWLDIDRLSGDQRPAMERPPDKRSLWNKICGVSA